MRELSLFTGAGGGILGSKILGWHCVGYVEYEKYCQEIIKQRIADGILDAAPIFGDIRKFISDGYAGSYQGMVDIVTGGFPCQPFSVAGKRAGADDPRNMWPSTIEVIRLVRPRYAFLENVPGLLSSGYFGQILGDLAESGYDARWTCCGADDVGANHRRKRLWILAYTISGGRRSRRPQLQGQKRTPSSVCSGSPLAYTMPSGKREESWKEKIEGNVMANPHSPGREEQRGAESIREELVTAECGGEKMADTLINDSGGAQKQKADRQQHGIGNDRDAVGNDAGNSSWWWKIEPPLGRLADGISGRVDMLKGLGNAQVPLCMAYAFSKLSEGIVECPAP